MDVVRWIFSGKVIDSSPRAEAQKHASEALPPPGFSEIGLGFKKGRLRGHDIRASGRQVRVRPMGIAALFPSNLKLGMTAS
jgi:hypothetical protein